MTRRKKCRVREIRDDVESRFPLPELLPDKISFVRHIGAHAKNMCIAYDENHGSLTHDELMRFSELWFK